MKTLVLLLTIHMSSGSFAPAAFATATLTLEGTVFGKTESSFQILTKGEIYTIQKKGLTSDQVNYFNTLKWNAPVTLSVPLNAVASVKTQKK